jgi:hypothetical protein
MFRLLASRIRPLSFGRWCRVVLLVLGLGLSGCAKLDIRGDKFAEDDLSTMPGKIRSHESTGGTWGVSNKAVQIEHNLGY